MAGLNRGEDSGAGGATARAFPPRLRRIVTDHCARVGGVGVQVCVTLGARGSIFECSAGAVPPTGVDGAAEATAIFKCASQAKPVVAACAARLAQAGLIDLDEPVRVWVPEWPRLCGMEGIDPAWVERVTLRALLSHTAGFVTRGFPQTELDAGEVSVEAILGGRFGEEHHCRIEYEPGTACVYAGAGYVLAQLAMERRVGGSISAIVQREVFAPLGMSRSRLGHVEGAERPAWPEPGRRRWFPAVGSSGLYSTVEDLARFWSAVGSPASEWLAPTWSGQLVRPHGESEGGFTFGLGFAIAANGSATVFKHAGWCDEAWVAAEGIVGSRFAVAAAANVSGETGKAAVLPLLGRVTQFVLERGLDRNPAWAAGGVG